MFALELQCYVPRLACFPGFRLSLCGETADYLCVVSPFVKAWEDQKEALWSVVQGHMCTSLGQGALLTLQTHSPLILWGREVIVIMICQSSSCAGHMHYAPASPSLAAYTTNLLVPLLLCRCRIGTAVCPIAAITTHLQYPLLTGHHQRIAELPGIKEYLASPQRLEKINGNGLG